MFKRFVKLWQGFCKFILSEKKWCWPRQSDVLILDSTRPGAVLMEYLEPWSPEVLYMRGEQFNIPVLLSSFFKPESIINAYTNSYIEKVCPRLVVTFMDTYVNFFTLSKKNPGVKTLFVQNGLRGYYYSIFEKFESLDSEITSKFFVDYMLVFGLDIGKEYSRCIGGDMVVMGSVKNNLARKEKLPQRDVIAFVSQWRQTDEVEIDGEYYTFKEFWVEPDRIVVQCLMQYAKARNKRLMIIPNRLKNPSEDLVRREEDYYRELLGSEPEILPIGTLSCLSGC